VGSRFIAIQAKFRLAANTVASLVAAIILVGEQPPLVELLLILFVRTAQNHSP
jgi:hypothetical protein